MFTCSFGQKCTKVHTLLNVAKCCANKSYKSYSNHNFFFFLSTWINSISFGIAWPCVVGDTKCEKIGVRMKMQNGKFAKCNNKCQILWWFCRLNHYDDYSIIRCRFYIFLVELCLAMPHKKSIKALHIFQYLKLKNGNNTHTHT